MENQENIFKRVFNFIKRMFGNETPKQIAEKTNIVKEKTKTDFRDELRVYDEEDSALLKLQNQYEKNEIDLSNLSDEQIHNLISLYKKQVSELSKKLNSKKTELTIMQHKIKSYSANL